MNQLCNIYDYKIGLQSAENIFRRLKSVEREVSKLCKVPSNSIGQAFFWFPFLYFGADFRVYIFTVVLFLRVREIVD